MQAWGGTAAMGSLKQPHWTKGLNFPSKGSSKSSCISGFPNQVKISSVKPCRSSQLEDNLVTGRPPRLPCLLCLKVTILT